MGTRPWLATHQASPTCEYCPSGAGLRQLQQDEVDNTQDPAVGVLPQDAFASGRTLSDRGGTPYLAAASWLDDASRIDHSIAHRNCKKERFRTQEDAAPIWQHNTSQARKQAHEANNGPVKCIPASNKCRSSTSDKLGHEVVQCLGLVDEPSGGINPALL